MLAIPKPQSGTPDQRNVAKLKTDFYQAGVSWETPEAADRYQWTKHAAGGSQRNSHKLSGT